MSRRRGWGRKSWSRAAVLLVLALMGPEPYGGCDEAQQPGVRPVPVCQVLELLR